MSDTRILDYGRACVALKLAGQAVASLQSVRAEISVIVGETHEAVAVANRALAASREAYRALESITATCLRAAERAS